MPGFVKKLLVKYQRPTPAKPQHAPAKSVPINYGAKVQQKTPEDKSQPLSAAEIKRIQDVVGTFGWYSRAADPTMVQSLSSIAGRQAKTTKSRAAGHHYLTTKSDHDLNNGAILTLIKIIKHVKGPAGELEVAALYYNCKSALPLKTCLEEMGHEQPKTPVVTDNSTAAGLIGKTMTPKRAKAYDQRFNWLKCREAQKQFSLIWERGKLNPADYHTKRHSINVYREKRADFVQ